MATQWLNPKSEASYALPQAFARTNQWWVQQWGHLLTFQMRSLKSCVEMGIYQLRAAAEVTDLASFSDFCQRQALVAQTIQQKVLNDTRRLSSPTTRFAAGGHLAAQTPVRTLQKAA